MNFHFAHHSRASFCLSTIMQTMRESWTDERLDDGFGRVSADIQSLRQEMGAMRVELRQEIGSVRVELREEIGSLRQGLDDLRNILMYVGGAMVVGMLGVLVAAFAILVNLA
jgi:hypothetical protein